MDALSRVTDAQIDIICEAFVSVSWPLGRDDFKALVRGTDDPQAIADAINAGIED